MFITPTPSAFNPKSSVGPNMPGHSNNQGKGSPILATPLGTEFLFVCVVPTCAIITPFSTSACASAMSCPALSSSANNIGRIIIPAPCSLNFHIRSAILSRDHGHCPLASIAASSISTTTMPWL